MRRARLECAHVRVPLDWDRPDGAKITLKVVRHLASRPEQRIGSLFVNFGGPGVAGAATVQATGKFLDRLGGGRFDVVGWDPRGTGESTHVRCFAERRGPGTVLGSRLDDTHDPRGVTTLCAPDRRLCAAVRGAERRPAGTHLDQGYGPRPRLSAPTGRRSPADLSRPLLRHVSRPDLRQHVPAPGAGDDPGRGDRCGRIHEVGRGEHRQERGRERPGVRAVPGAVSGGGSEEMRTCRQGPGRAAGPRAAAAPAPGADPGAIGTPATPTSLRRRADRILVDARDPVHLAAARGRPR